MNFAKANKEHYMSVYVFVCFCLGFIFVNVFTCLLDWFLVLLSNDHSFIILSM